MRLLAGALLLAAAPALAQPRLEVQGTVEPGTPLLVVLELRNAGTDAASDIAVEGELAGEYDAAKVREPLKAGATTRLALSFRRPAPGPGVHPLALLVDYKDGRGGVTSQRAWLLVSFGPTAPPADGVILSLPDTTLSTAAELPVRVRSRAGPARRVRLRVLPPRGLQVPDVAPVVDLPPGGDVTVPVRLLRSGAPRPSTQGLVAFAEWDEGGQAAAAVTTATVQVAADPAVLPRVRKWLVAAGVLLLVAAAGVELARFRRSRHEA